MKVTGGGSGVGSTRGVSGGKPAANVKAPASPSPVVAADAVTVSGNAQLISDVHARVDALPDIRMEKVEALKAQIDSDQYHPDGEAVADGLMKEHTPPPAQP